MWRNTIVVLLLLERERQDILADCALVVAVALRHLLVLVERDHLVEELLGHLVQRCELEWSDADLDVVQLPDYRLHFRVFDAIQRFNHLQVVLLLLIFEDGCLNWRKMLLVAQIDMVQQWTLSWQECAGELERFRMPELRFLLLCWRVEALIFFHLNYESDFC